MKSLYHNSKIGIVFLNFFSCHHPKWQSHSRSHERTSPLGYKILVCLLVLVRCPLTVLQEFHLYKFALVTPCGEATLGSEVLRIKAERRHGA